MDASIAAIERNIVKEIMRECFPRKIKTNENFVHFLIKLLLLDPNWGIRDHFVTRDKVAKFVDYVINKLTNPYDPKLVTLQMQYYFICNLENLDNVPKKTRRELLERLYPLKNDIFETNDLTYEESVSLLRKKIVCYVTLVSGLGNPKQENIYREAVAAFKSVMSEEELKEFITFSRQQKEKELVNLTNVVCGIRLFNKDCCRGGAGIEELPALLDAALKSVKNDLQNGLATVMEKVNLLTTVADQCYEVQKTLTGKDEHIMVCTLAPDIQNIYMENIKDLLVFHRQYEVYLRQILEELDNSEKRSSEINDEFQEMLEKIHESIYMKIAAPADTIFPLFEKLAMIWATLQNEVIKLTRFSEISINLELYSKNTHFSRGLFETFIDETLTDMERLDKTANFQLTSSNSNVKIIDAESFPDNYVIPFQFLGFCCWTMVETGGTLIPGNPAMGVACYEEKFYIFATPEACQGFSENPANYIRKVLDMARKRTYLIKFLSLQKQLQNVKDILVLAEAKVTLRVTENKAMETEDFQEIIPTNIDPTYFWNVWDLKREALLLADLSRRKTVSTQTIKTFSTNCMKSQTSRMKSRTIQTMRDNYSNVPKPSNFVYGLRGRKDDEQFIIELTRPVKE